MNEHTIYCPKCGAEMKSTMRYCMKCGELNYDHPDNQNMKPFIKKKFGFMGRNRFVSTDADTGKAIDSRKQTIYAVISCIILCLLNFVLLYHVTQYLIFYIITLVFYFYLFCIEELYIKIDKHWYTALIPIYNLVIFYEYTLESVMFFLLSLIPGVGLVFYFMALYKLGQKFNFNGLISAIFAPIAIPIMAIGHYKSNYRVNDFMPDSKGVTLAEKNYKLKRAILSIGIIIVVIIAVYYSFPYLKDIYNNFIEFLKENGFDNFINEITNILKSIGFNK